MTAANHLARSVDQCPHADGSELAAAWHAWRDKLAEANTAGRRVAALESQISEIGRRLGVVTRRAHVEDNNTERQALRSELARLEAERQAAESQANHLGSAAALRRGDYESLAREIQTAARAAR